MKNEYIPTIKIKSENDEQEISGTWFRGKTCNFYPSKKQYEQNDFFKNFILKGHTPEKPFIDKEKKIIAFGSCFASHVSKYLINKRYSVFDKRLGHNQHIIRYGEGMANTFTVLEQLLWAFENKNIEKNTWYYSPKISETNDDLMREETLRALKMVDVFIITVGLSEVWFNKVNNQVFWKAIPASEYDERKHGFRVSSVDENTRNLKEIYLIIKKHLPLAKVIFTLSPIPLVATFRDQSCITANSISKSILRVSLDNILNEYKKNQDIYYFPSYEIVNQFFNDPFKDDNRHLKDEYIIKIMQLFEKNFCIH
tara:strand:+ start:24631 stop:25563 length:933 start_codon:yes stop_codon:yes gene_type:complete